MFRGFPSWLVLPAMLLFLLPAAADAQIFRREKETSKPGAPKKKLERPPCEITGGLLLHLNCGEGMRSMELCHSGAYLVHALTADDKAIELIRNNVFAAGLEGRIVAEYLREKALPYHDNVVSCAVLDEGKLGSIPLKEIARVLRPGGRLEAAKKHCGSASKMTSAGFTRVREENGYFIGEKKWDDRMGDWTHFRNDAGRNPVSDDTALGVCNSVRWVFGRKGGGEIILSAQGRNFYVDRRSILVRDAFTGIPLWEVRSGRGGAYPVAVGNRLYVASGGSITEYDAANGKNLRSLSCPGSTADFVVLDGKIVGRDGGSVWVVDLESGKTSWTTKCDSPRVLLAGDGGVYVLTGNAKRGGACGVLALDLATGEEKWKKSGSEYSWAGRSDQGAYGGGKLAYQISTYADEGRGNALHIVDAKTGATIGDRSYTPGMTHAKEARAFIVNGVVMIHGGGGSGFGAGREFQPALEKSGGVRGRAGGGHCYSGVATQRYFIHGEMDFTDIRTGKKTANQITKGACGRKGRGGYMPACGMLFSKPKHCVCFPMLEGFAAFAEIPVARLASKRVYAFRGGSGTRPLLRPKTGGGDASGASWPMYRNDAIRSASSSTLVPDKLKVIWGADVAGVKQGEKSLSASSTVSGLSAELLTNAWRDNPYVRARFTQPVVDYGRVVVAEADRHRVLGFEAETGKSAWTFVANGRVDCSPTIHEGLCLFGTRSGYIYALNVMDGTPRWMGYVGPQDRRIVAYGQLESVWPVSGSILIHNKVAYAAAGRHPLADGGVQVLCFDPKTGRAKWQNAATEIGIRRWYGRQGLDYDYFDHLVVDGGQIAMSRWKFHPANGQVKLEHQDGYFQAGGVFVPFNFWNYGYPMNRKRTDRQLMVYNGNELYGIHKGKLFRQDFSGGKFNDTWYSEYDNASGKGMDRMDRIVQGTKWSIGAPKNVKAMVLTQNRLFVVSGGSLIGYDRADGKKKSNLNVGDAAWDGMAAAGGRLYIVQSSGKLVCAGE